MKIGIITHYDVHNHGALLQLYALKSVLDKKGHNAKALSFKKNFDFLPAGIDKKYDISIKSLFWYISFIKKIGIKRTVFNIKKKRILDKFRKPLMGEYYSRAKDLDAVFVGSDEVFSVEGGVNPFFFGIGVPCDNIYSYAACCGPVNDEEIKEKNMHALISAGLMQFKKISVRDSNTKEVVLKLAERESQVVCDPVILYDFKEEQEVFTRKIAKDYLVVYAYDNNMNDKNDIEAIRAYAKKNNLQTVSVGFYHKWCDKCVDASPVEIMSYFKYAKCVFTDTFHGSVISMVTNTEFVAKINVNKNKLYDLLSRFDTADRIVENFENAEKVLENKIDYKNVNALMEQYRKQSMSYLDSCMEDCKDE